MSIPGPVLGSAFYFSDAGQEVIVSASQVRAGAPDLPYSLTQAGAVTPDGTTTLVGCQTWQNTTLADLYTRPDGTTYTLQKGAGAPIAVPGTALVGGAHTDVNCCGAGGTAVAIGGGSSLCKKSGSSCPNGWSAHLKWTTTQSQSGQGCAWRDGITGQCYQPGSVCSTGAHGFSDTPIETCTTGDGGGATATVIEIGCK